MMNYNGVAGHYSLVRTLGSNTYTVVLKFNLDAFSGDKYVAPVNLAVTGGTHRLHCLIFSDDYTGDTSLRGRMQVYVQTSAGGTIVIHESIEVVADGTDKTMFFSVNASAPATTWYINGVNADDTGHPSRALNSGGMDTGSGGITLGAAVQQDFFFPGRIGYFGYREAYLVNPTDFYHPTKGLQKLDEVGWTEWLSQPLLWEAEGIMDNHKGLAANMVLHTGVTGPT